MGYVGNSPALKYTSFAVQHFTTSATTGYTLDHAVNNENDIRLVINNVVQQPGSSYAYTASGTTLTLSAATAGTDTMYCVFLGKAVQTVNPSQDSVGTSQLQANAVTAAKFNADVISGQTELATTPADTDEFIISDSGVLKRIDYSHIKSTAGLTKLADVTITDGDASEQINGCFSDTYESYLIQLLGAGVNAEAEIMVQGVYSTDTVISSGNYFIVRGYNEDGDAGTDYGSNQSDAGLFGTSVLANEWNFANIWYHRPLSVGSFKQRLFGNSSHIRHSGSKLHANYFAIGIDNTNKLTGLKFSTSTSTFKQGQVIVWGYST